MENKTKEVIYNTAKDKMNNPDWKNFLQWNFSGSFKSGIFNKKYLDLGRGMLGNSTSRTSYGRGRTASRMG